MLVKICFIGYLIILSIYDVKYKKIPSKLLVLGGLSAAMWMFFRLWEDLDHWKELSADWGFGIMPGVFVLLIAFLGGKIGEGDGYILILTGIITGGGKAIVVFAISLILAAVFSIWLILVHKAGRSYSFPYLPFIAAAYVLWLFIERTGKYI